ncbi:ABC transporter ATP-binding protein [Rhizobium sp. L1K21]|uniref:ABC transporter ATP-binding protein n=1 Tax=Rhizobium sp. L1K21 TaxID=2954933 RepID=UPI00209335F1|nr:sn-glycerol-3-phosphate ABC transporter ATP-binding protein UgpC [Rhizobium sp. L1K21]MCO6187605.1 sn-glycerol-3-phosphate ABC transporter ATP-binding protein UgpC [Rhizobium sp. L1K21]
MANLQIANARKSYDNKQVLHGIDLHIEDGTFLVIVGPSGCGKSTLLRMIAGLEDITDGTISIDDEVVNDLEPSARGCAMVFQNYALYPHMSVEQNIGYPLKIAGVSKPERARKVAEAAALLELGDYLDRRPAQLSGGQRQRVAMGRAIVREPRLFLFDEPLSNLDAKLRVQMRIEIKRLHRRLSATSVFVTHDQVEAMTLADKLVVMNAGKVEQVGTPGEIYRAPASAFVAGFLGAPAMNFLPGKVLQQGNLHILPNTEIAVHSQELHQWTGREITIGIRPESLLLGKPSAEGIPAHVDLIEELGGSRVAYCRTDGPEIAVVMHGDLTVREGDRVSIGLLPEHLHFFEKTNGQRLGGGQASQQAQASRAMHVAFN